MSNYSNAIAGYFVKKGWLTPELQAWGAYAVEKRILHLVAVLIFIVLLGAICGYINALAFYATFSLLRGCCGGWHASKPLHCVCVSVLVAIGLGFLQYVLAMGVCVISVCCIIPSVVVLFRWAPAHTAQMKLTEEEYVACRKQMKSRTIGCGFAALLCMLIPSQYVCTAGGYIAFAFLLAAVSVGVMQINRIGKNGRTGT